VNAALDVERAVGVVGQRLENASGITVAGICRARIEVIAQQGSADAFQPFPGIVGLTDVGSGADVLVVTSYALGFPFDDAWISPFTGLGITPRPFTGMVGLTVMN
jgi:hypothetical protein